MSRVIGTGGLLSKCLQALAVVGALAATTRLPAAQQTPRLITFLEGKHVEEALADLNLVGKEVSQGAYLFEHKGIKVVLRNYGRTMMMQASFLDTPMTLTQLNAWNKKERFTRAYQDDKRTILEADHEVTGGVTLINVKEAIKTYLDRLQAFKKVLDESSRPVVPTSRLGRAG